MCSLVSGVGEGRSIASLTNIGIIIGIAMFSFLARELILIFADEAFGNRSFQLCDFLCEELEKMRFCEGLAMEFKGNYLNYYVLMSGLCTLFYQSSISEISVLSSLYHKPGHKQHRGISNSH